MVQRNLRNTSIYSVYLKGEGLGTDGRPLGQNEEQPSKDKVRVECAEIIAAKLSEAYASLEVAKELGIFNNEYADNIVNTAKDSANQHTYRKAYFKADIYKKLNKALAVAGKEPLGGQVAVNEQSEFK